MSRIAKGFSETPRGQFGRSAKTRLPSKFAEKWAYGRGAAREPAIVGRQQMTIPQGRAGRHDLCHRGASVRPFEPRT
jgi:hypothetical protein